MLLFCLIELCKRLRWSTILSQVKQSNAEYSICGTVASELPLLVRDGSERARCFREEIHIGTRFCLILSERNARVTV